MRAQGSLEYLVIVLTAVAVLAIAASFITSYFSTQSGQFYYASCSSAAALCRDTLLVDSSNGCAVCDNACNFSNGTEIFTNATTCCKRGEPDKIYSNAPGCVSPYCGDGDIFGPEACDPPDSSCGTAGTCSSNCLTCAEPPPTIICGDGNINSPEVCEGPGDPCGTGGTCSFNCLTCEPPISCSVDGTPINQCSITYIGKNCSTTGYLFDDCVHCSCLTGSSCNATTKACYLSCDPDPTPRGQCATPKPNYCNMLGGIVSNCTKCGCPTGTSCNALTERCGTCPFSSSASLSTPYFPSSFAIGDVDGISGNELVVSLYSESFTTGTGELRVYKYDGSSWTNETIGILSRGIRAMAIGDVDKDSANEIVVANYNNVSMYEKIGGVWQKTLIKTNLPTFVQSIAIGDADNDDQNEVVVGLAWLRDDYGLKLYKYDAGSWKETNISKLIAYVNSVAVGDADNNKLNEIVIGTECCIDNELRLYRLVGTSWQEEPIVDLQNNVESVTIGDADNDKLNEIVTGGRWAEYRIRLYENTTIPIGPSSWRMVPISSDVGLIFSTALGDADNDGLNEVLAGSDGGELKLFKNESGGWSDTLIGSTKTRIVSSVIGNADNIPGNEVISETSTCFPYEFCTPLYGIKIYSCNSWVY